MKRFISTIVFALITVSSIGQTTDADKIRGTYSNEGGKGKVTIKKNGHKYHGVLVWTHVPDATDKNNPDKSRRANKLAGTEIVQGFEYSGNNVWEKGTIYDPESGKTYSGKITLKKDGSLDMRGFVGISLLGRTTVWRRYK
jgi:uncharacterized protein (DUF2147 family)